MNLWTSGTWPPLLHTHILLICQCMNQYITCIYLKQFHDQFILHSEAEPQYVNGVYVVNVLYVSFVTRYHPSQNQSQGLPGSAGRRGGGFIMIFSLEHLHHLPWSLPSVIFIKITRVQQSIQWLKWLFFISAKVCSYTDKILKNRESTCTFYILISIK